MVDKEFNEDIISQEESFDFKELLFKILSRWYYFLFFGIIGAGAGYYKARSVPAQYQVSCQLLVKETKTSLGLESLFGDSRMRYSPNVQNHIAVMQSYSVVQQTIENLNWNFFWYKEGVFSQIDLFGREPFLLVESDSADNPKGKNLFIKVRSENSYTAYLSKEDKNGFVGYYGKPFTHENFNFILYNKNAESDVSYYVVFNDITSLTQSYRGRLKVSLTNEAAELVTLQITGTVAQKEVDFLNELVKVYIQKGMNEKNRTSENTVKFIDVQLTSIVDSLRDKGKTFTNFKAQKQIFDIGSESRILLERMQEVESQLYISNMKLNYYENLKAYINDADKMATMVSPTVIGISDFVFNAQIANLNDLYQRRRTLQLSVRDNNPAMKQIDTEIQVSQASLRLNIDNLLENANMDSKEITQRKQNLESKMAVLPKTEQEMLNIKREFDLNNDLYTFLLKKRAEAAISQASNVPDAQIIDPARTNTASKVGLKIQQNVGIGIILGFGIPLTFIILFDYFNVKLEFRDEVEKKIKSTVIGGIPHNNYQTELPVVDNPRSGISESFRSIRTNLQYYISDSEKKVISIHSIVPGEGKTFISSNLAAIFAMNNKKTLLVGVDLRRPRLQNIFEYKKNCGLSTYLIHENSFEEVVNTTTIKNLDFVTSGPIPPNPSELLGSNMFEKFINEARAQYDIIILDNSPLAIVSDGLITTLFSDINLFLLRLNFSHKDQINFINMLIDQKKVVNTATILNDSDVRKTRYSNKYGSYRYGEGYRYGYGQGYYEDDTEVVVKKSLLKRLYNLFSL